VPGVGGRELDLASLGQSYRLRVFSVGSWRYRVHFEGRVISARFGEVAPHTARVVIGGRYYRATYDLTDAAIRVEIEGCVHRFGRQTVGQVRAGAPSMVVSIDVTPGQRVAAGQHLGLLEAMKMEIGFSAPVAGTVNEVRVSKGQQVAAGELLLVIEPLRDDAGGASNGERLRLPEEQEPLAALFRPSEDQQLGTPDLRAAEAAVPEARSRALEAVNAEVERMMLGWDVYEPRYEKLLEFLEAPVPDGLSADFRRELAAVRDGLIAFVDVEQLFSHSRRVEEGGTLGPSNNARLRTYLRRTHSQGAGIAQDFLDTLRAALAHYDIDSLEYSEHLERALLRMFASQRDPSHRHRLVMSVLRRIIALVNSGISLADDPALRDALVRIAAMRGEVSNAVADTALEAHYRAYQGVEMVRHAESTTRDLERWLAVAESAGQTPSPPAEVLEGLAIAPAAVFARVEEWLRSADRWKRVIALSAYVRRLYAPKKPQSHRSELIDGRWVDRSRHDGKLVLAAVCAPDEVPATLRSLGSSANTADTLAIELIVTADDPAGTAGWLARIKDGLPNGLHAQRITISVLGTNESHSHLSFAAGDRGIEALELHGLHPETAARIDLVRYCNFELERLWSPEDLYCFYARARQDPEDQRLFVLGDVRARPAAEGHSAELFTGIFERAFQEAARTLRLNLGIRDPRRLLHWNRLAMHMAHPVVLDALTAQRMARRLLSNIQHLGVEKTIVRLKLLSAERPQDPPREIEVVGSDLASSRLELTWRRPRKQPLVPASPYDRKVAESRRRGLVYPYEIVRMLTSGDEARERAVEESERDRRPVLPVGRFEEYDLDPTTEEPTAVSVASRTPGLNQSAVVFGVMTTPTVKVPEGMRRVLVLSDPTRGMGALAGRECDRVVAAIDLAERLQLPVEWLPISSGARIAMDSGTENMDATARVVRRIVTFTNHGGVIHLIVAGINVGAQSYWDALATMLMHTKGVLIMTPEASMVLTGSASLAASGSVSAEDEVTIGGHERVMGPNGQAQYFASDLLDAYQTLYHHYEYTYVVPGESGPRKHETIDPETRDLREFAYQANPAHGAHDFSHVGDVFDEDKNPGRKRPFSMRALMRSAIDVDGRYLERWSSHASAETAIVWDAHIGGHPVCLIGIESQNVPRLGYRPSDGPEEWNGGTLFPQSSKKVARALNSASGNRPAVILANLSGFDGSPESMRKLQLEYGAEIARAVVNFQGPILFLVVSRYHGGAYVVFSRELNDSLRAIAVEGSYASVIGGGPAATVVFAREVRARVAADPRIQALRGHLQDSPTAEERAVFDRARRDVTIEKRAEVAAEFDSIHTVDRAKRVGSLEGIIAARDIRSCLIDLLGG
jgi:acetyl-CoA carboxylase carboxyltransferase component/biotin carboxyl carrier protein